LSSRGTEPGGVAEWREGFVLALAVLAFGLAGASAICLLDVDEPRFATASRTMVEGGSLIVPWFNGAERFDKPILIYWLQALSMLLFGKGEAAARLPSALGIALASLTTWRSGRLLGLGRVPALLAGFVFGFGILPQVLAHAATADAWMLGMLGLVTTAQIRRFRVGPGAGSWFVLWTALALAFLAKGPPALVAPLALGAAFPWAGRKARRSTLVLGLFYAGALVAAWAVPAMIESEGRFWSQGLMKHVVSRSLRPFEGHGGYAPWWYLFYVVSIPLTFLPWTPFLGFLGEGLRWRGARGGEEAAVSKLLLAWILGTVLVFSLVTSKMVHYVLPAYPALALAFARGFESWNEKGALASRLPGRAFARLALPGFGLLLLLGPPAAALALRFDGETFYVLLVLGICLGGAMLAASRFLMDEGSRRPLLGLPAPLFFCALGSFLGLGILAARGLPALYPQTVLARSIEGLKRKLRPEDRVYLHRIVMPSLVFYLRRELPRIPGGETGDSNEACLRALLSGARVLTAGRRLPDLEARLQGWKERGEPRAAEAARILGRPLFRVRGFWPSRGRFEDLVLLGASLWSAEGPPPPKGPGGGR